MGREVVRAISASADMELVAAIDPSHADSDAGEVAGMSPLGISIQPDLSETLLTVAPSVMVDFTIPSSAMSNIETALKRGTTPVVGTTGLTSAEVERISVLCEETNTPALIAPNFAIGAVLMMQFAAQAAVYMPDVEIIELHHDKKVDSPSGTAVLTAQTITEARRGSTVETPLNLVEKIPYARGADSEGLRIHSVRLPGLVAHQEVIFGGVGQTLTIRHDSTDRRSFMPGVLLAIRRVRGLKGLTIGLEHLLK